MLVAPSLRASQPSKKSVTAATTKAKNAQRSSAHCTGWVSWPLSQGTSPARDRQGHEHEQARAPGAGR